MLTLLTLIADATAANLLSPTRSSEKSPCESHRLSMPRFENVAAPDCASATHRVSGGRPARPPGGGDEEEACLTIWNLSSSVCAKKMPPSRREHLPELA